MFHIQRITRKLKFGLIFFILLFRGSSLQAQIWNYDFGTGTGSYTTPGESTSFLPAAPSGTSRIRVGSAGGSFNMENPGLATLGSETELRGVASTSTSYNKFSIYDFTPSMVGYLKFKVLLGDNSGQTSATDGTWSLFIGDGSMYSDNNGSQVIRYFRGCSGLSEHPVALPRNTGVAVTGQTSVQPQ